jgi:cytochrome c1
MTCRTKSRRSLEEDAVRHTAPTAFVRSSRAQLLKTLSARLKDERSNRFPSGKRHLHKMWSIPASNSGDVGAQITDAEAARMNIRRAGRIAFLRLPLVCGDRIVTPEALKPVGNQSFSQPPQAPAEDRETAATAFASKPADLHYWCARGQATAVWRHPRRSASVPSFSIRCARPRAAAPHTAAS